MLCKKFCLEYRKSLQPRIMGYQKHCFNLACKKDKILAAYESGEIDPKRQKMKRAENEDLDKAVYTWFHNTHANNVPVSGTVLKEKALQSAKSLHLDDFRASDGWPFFIRRFHQNQCTSKTNNVQEGNSVRYV